MKSRGLVVFDVDGTLVDSQHLIVAAMMAAYAALGVPPPPPPAVRRIIGLSLIDAVAGLSPDGDPSFHADVAQAYKEAHSALRGRSSHEEPLFAGARDTLDALVKEGWLIGIATGKSRRGVLNLIERHGLEGYFVTLQTADDNPSKPNPTMLRRALAEAGVDAERSVMVGDTSYDMIMGHTVGVRCIGVSWGNHPSEDLLRGGADVVIDDFADLPFHVARPTEERGTFTPTGC
jgi:phosphoglycolate phosphatase